MLQSVLEAVEDQTESIDEIGLYLLLRQEDHEDLPFEPGDILEANWSTLVEGPDAYRGQWVRVACRYVEAERGQLDNPQLFGKPIFTVMGMDAAKGEPVSMVATVGPGFDRNDPVWLEGRFFKIRSAAPRHPSDKNENEKLLIPVLVGREVRARNAYNRSDSISGREALTWSIGMVGALLVVWMVARRQSRRWGQSPRRRWVENGQAYGEDAFEPIDLERLENERIGEDGEAK